jgi:hypothetical protein
MGYPDLCGRAAKMVVLDMDTPTSESDFRILMRGVSDLISQSGLEYPAGVARDMVGSPMRFDGTRCSYRVLREAVSAALTGGFAADFRFVVEVT